MTALHELAKSGFCDHIWFFRACCHLLSLSCVGSSRPYIGTTDLDYYNAIFKL
jgi:hypothetical protein